MLTWTLRGGADLWESSGESLGIISFGKSVGPLEANIPYSRGWTVDLERLESWRAL